MAANESFAETGTVALQDDTVQSLEYAIAGAMRGAALRASVAWPPQPLAPVPTATAREGGGGRLVVVSNRVALPGAASAGGLAVAMNAALKAHGGLWFGWSGQFAESEASPARICRDGRVSYVTVDLSRADYEAYYAQFSNRTLWPLLHTRPGLVDFDGASLQRYFAVNRRFAEQLAPMLRGGDSVWVHDYHLLPLGKILRERGVRTRLGFFLHTPLPAPDLIASLPQHRDVFGALASYDVVGFQTQRDLRSFVAYAQDYLGARRQGERSLVFPDGRRVHADAFPIGIDTADVVRLGEAAVELPSYRAFQASLQGKLAAIGVDRLDYSKGLPKRVEGFGRLLHNAPELRRRVCMLQIAPLSRTEVAEYRDLRKRLERSIGSVNSAYASADWVPIRYVNSSYGHEELMGYYRASRVGVVTPWRDGMNLVAKEYVAAQDPADPGVLVLSEGAGAAEELTDALLVNPLDTEDLARALQTAFAMDVSERRRRWENMMSTLSRNDVHQWRRNFLGALTGAEVRIDRG